MRWPAVSTRVRSQMQIDVSVCEVRRLPASSKLSTEPLSCEAEISLPAAYASLKLCSEDWEEPVPLTVPLKHLCLGHQVRRRVVTIQSAL